MKGKLSKSMSYHRQHVNKIKKIVQYCRKFQCERGKRGEFTIYSHDLLSNKSNKEVMLVFFSEAYNVNDSLH